MKMRLSVLFVVGLATSVLGAGNAQAQEVAQQTAATGPAETFGGKGQIAISSDAALSAQRATRSGISGGTTTIQLEPAADYFFMGNVSIGGFVGFNYAKSGENHSTRLAIGPRLGYNLVLSDMISIWPKAGVSFASTSTTVGQSMSTTATTTTTRTTETTETTTALNLFAPVMFHPAPHFFAGFGPFLDTDLNGDTRTTVWGGKLTIGGWI